MLVREIMRRDVLTASPDMAVTEAARKMADNHVGSLVVTKGGKILGIVTERNILLSLAEYGHDIEQKTLADVMTSYVITINPDSPVSKAVRVMNENSIKKLPVIEDENLVGMVSVSDIIVAQPALMKELAGCVIRKSRE